MSGPENILIGGATIRAEHGELLVILEHVHWMVHKGRLFQGEHLDAALADDGNLDLLLTTGSKETHTTMQASAGGACNVYLYEEPTTSGGITVPLRNLRRISTKTPEGTLVHTPSVSAVGTALVPGRYLPGGATQQTRGGAVVREATEWDLKPNTKYLLRLTNNSGSTIQASMALAFYEHDEDEE